MNDTSATSSRPNGGKHKQFEQVVLEGGGGQHQEVTPPDRLLDGVGDLVAGLVHVAEAVRLIDDDEVPEQTPVAAATAGVPSFRLLSSSS